MQKTKSIPNTTPWGYYILQEKESTLQYYPMVLGQMQMDIKQIKIRMLIQETLVAKRNSEKSLKRTKLGKT
jgi:hypothetical protein